nr:GGDEF domain-containing protein [Clostridium paridis]
MDKEILIKILKEKDELLKRLVLEKEKLNYYASIDPLTDVLNRRSGLVQLSKELDLSKINGNNLVVCFVDIDKFKIINDVFGHEEGDKLLINTSLILKNSIRKTDFVIRMGGDEFLVVFPETTIREVNKVWYRILKSVEESNRNNEKYNLSLSYGCYEYGNEIENKVTVNDLIRRADIEMYKIKNVKKEDFNYKYRNNVRW